MYVRITRHSKTLSHGVAAFLTSVLLLSQIATAQGQHDHGNYTVYHTIFNSTFLQPKIAEAYDLVRGEKLFYLNISVNGGGQLFGQEAELIGTASDLMQNRKTLEFRKIDEGEAVYYMAPIRLASQDILHFAIDVKTAAEANPFTVKFTHKFAKE